jgi:carbon storage regulator
MFGMGGSFLQVWGMQVFYPWCPASRKAVQPGNPLPAIQQHPDLEGLGKAYNGNVSETTAFTITEGRAMLVLSRKRGETIVIGEDITVTVLATEGDRVKLGIDAPAEIPVHRKEVYRRIVDRPDCFRLAECA